MMWQKFYQFGMTPESQIKYVLIFNWLKMVVEVFVPF